MNPNERDIHLSLQDLAPNAIDLSHNRYIKPEDIKVGNRFTGIDFDPGMFQVVNSFKLYLREKIKPEEIEQYGRVDEHRFDRVLDVIRRLAEKKKFYGKLVGCDLIILPPNLAIVPKKEFQQEIEVDDAVSFMTEVEMHSTGKGRIGSLMSVSTVYRAHEPSGRNHSIGVVTKPLVVKKDVDEIERALLDARANPKNAYMYNVS